jgi:hypothetical protein
VALFFGEGLGVAFASTAFFAIGFAVGFGEAFGMGVPLGFGSGVKTGAGEGVAVGSWISLLADDGTGDLSCSSGFGRGLSVFGGGVSIAVSVCADTFCPATSVSPPLIQTMLCKSGLRVSRFQRMSTTIIAT